MDFTKFLDSTKSNLIVMVGISGSGKSTIAEEIFNQINLEAKNKTVILSPKKPQHVVVSDDELPQHVVSNFKNLPQIVVDKNFGTTSCVVLSSDTIRVKLFSDENDQTHNEQVFSYIKAQAFKILTQKEKTTVIIDATNLSIKDRSWVFNNIKNKVDCNIIACIVPTKFEKCKLQNSKRERVVPEFVLEKQIRKFEVPFYEEGWSKIVIWDVIDDDVLKNSCKCNQKGCPDKLLKKIENFDQKNRHHVFPLDEHCIKCYQEAQKRTNNAIILRAAQIHDICKPEVQAPREDNPDFSYFQHNNYGAYYLLSNWEDVGIRDWMQINTVDNLLECLFYVNFHMQPFFIQSEKSINKYQKLWGLEKYNNLMMFNECDKLSSGTERKDNE